MLVGGEVGSAGKALQAVSQIGGIGAQDVRNGGDLDQQRDQPAGFIAMPSPPDAGEAGFVDLAAAGGIELHRDLTMTEALLKVADACG